LVINDFFAATLGGDHQGGGLSEEHTEVAFATFLLTLFSAINLFIGKRREVKDLKEKKNQRRRIRRNLKQGCSFFGLKLLYFSLSHTHILNEVESKDKTTIFFLERIGSVCVR
jgi:hypothetical protein